MTGRSAWRLDTRNPFGNSEIQQLGGTVICEKDVRRLDVPMKNAVFVRRFEPPGDLDRDVNKLRNRNGSTDLYFFAERRPF